ncbi:hypothetical protein PR202_ga11351 [Eleusine coracana subsp. coracana]|uniref:F-box domain-containing protein n=1 Tax=Eleusine coracana subsp. coracana TaxID=191504 RepID=A0AAV5C988_ELECO|nr:hypothetical protein PR202_ga11351 [Eleusine coracana subsp. coracana]
MPRAQAAARKNAAAAACVPSRDGGWLSLRTSKRRNPSSRTGHNDDDGLPFSDEILLAIFACSGVLSLADLVRCGATCRRWLRLISTEAEFICRRSSAPPSASRCTGLAVGFFHQMPEGDPRFIPLNTSRFPSFELEAGEMFRAARVVVQGVHLLQASERSGIILFITSRYDQLNPSNCLYALDTGKKMAQPWMIVDALPDGICWWWPKSRGSFHGYEMDRVDFLASLGGRGDGGNGA